MNQAYVDGKWVREDRAVLPAFHTGLLYGESVFEAIPFYSGHPLFWQDHLARFKKGCAFLGWPAPAEPLLKRVAAEAWRRWRGGPEGILRFNWVSPVSPTESPAKPGPARPMLVAAFRALRHDPARDAPVDLNVGVARWRVPDGDAYPGAFKTAFYLTVRKELKAHPRWQEMLRLNSQGIVLDGAFSSPLLLSPGEVWAPPVGRGGLESVTRKKVLRLCAQWGWKVRTRAWRPTDCFRKGRELVFVGSGLAVGRVRRLNGKALPGEDPGAGKLWGAYRRWIRQTRGG